MNKLLWCSFVSIHHFSHDHPDFMTHEGNWWSFYIYSISKLLHQQLSTSIQFHLYSVHQASCWWYFSPFQPCAGLNLYLMSFDSYLMLPMVVKRSGQVCFMHIMSLFTDSDLYAASMLAWILAGWEGIKYLFHWTACKSIYNFYVFFSVFLVNILSLANKMKPS